MSERLRNASLGKAINIRRVELGLSRNDLRDRSGLSYPYVAELEKGAKSPSSRALEAIAAALEIRPHELLARAEELMLTDEVAAVDQPEAPPRAAAQAPSSSPSPGVRRWFGPAGSSPSPEVRPARSTPGTRRRPTTPPSEDPPLTEQRVREIVREELRRALGESLQ